MTEQEQAKYTYRFSFTNSKTNSTKDEPVKTDLQSYINDILGLDSKKEDRNKLPY